MLASIESTERMAVTLASHPSSPRKAMHTTFLVRAGCSDLRYSSLHTVVVDSSHIRASHLAKQRRLQSSINSIETDLTATGTWTCDTSTRQALDSHDKRVTTTATRSALRSHGKPHQLNPQQRLGNKRLCIAREQP